MAMVRCKECGAPGSIKRRYVANVKPLGYPNKAVLCYRRSCRNPGLVWLDEQDKANYDAGERAISIWGQGVKIKVT